MYTAFNIVGGIKFYLQNDNSMSKENTNPKKYTEKDIGYYFDRKLKRQILKVKYNQMNVELLS